MTIDHDAVDSYIVARRQQPFGHRRIKYPTTATINREVAALKKMFNVAVARKILPHNPILRYSLPPENNARDNALTHQEVERLLAICKQREHVSPHLYMAVFVALHTGLRHDNVVSLEWSNIDWDKNEIAVVVKHQRSKGPKMVRVPMMSALRNELRAWREKQARKAISRYVFPSPKKLGAHILVSSNIGLDTATKLARQSFLAEGNAESAAKFEKLTFHDFRHTFATLFLESFPDRIEVLREILGHSSSYMTRRYAHITERAKREAMDQFKIGGTTL